MKRFLLVVIFVLATNCELLAQRVKHPPEVLKAYRVCQRFRDLIAQDLDFDQAFESSFTENARRRREIAIYEGEFGDLDFSNVDDATLISAFKSRMQIFFLMLPLVGPNDEGEKDLFFPPAIKTIFERKPPLSAEGFRAYALQLKRDASDFRGHLNQLASTHPAVAERIRKFKSDLSKEIELPTHKVQPLTGYSRGKILGPREPYYQIGDYAVVRERGEMRIIGIRFFARLF